MPPMPDRAAAAFEYTARSPALGARKHAQDLLVAAGLPDATSRLPE